MKILFPVVRFTDVSKILSPFVENMAKVMNAEVHVLRVEEMIDQYLEMRIKEAEEWLEDFVQENLKQSRVHKAKVIPGDPAKKILEYVDAQEIDCVIIGTLGKKGLGAALFGSVASQVVGKAPVPVLSINPYLMTSAFKKRNAQYLERLMKGH